MVTENGLVRLKAARHHIEMLRDRRNWVQGRMDARVAEGRPPVHFDQAEVAAIDWALPILEAEWDTLARLHRNADRFDSRLKGFERKGKDDDLRAQPQWEGPCETLSG